MCSQRQKMTTSDSVNTYLNAYDKKFKLNIINFIYSSDGYGKLIPTNY